MKNLTLYIGVAASLALTGSPAFATVAQKVPEPGTLSMVGGIAVALLIANRFMRRR